VWVGLGALARRSSRKNRLARAVTRRASVNNKLGNVGLRCANPTYGYGYGLRKLVYAK